MQHVSGPCDVDDLDVAHHERTALIGCVRAEPRQITRTSPPTNMQHGRLDAAPASFGILALVEHRVHPAVPRVAQQMNPPVRPRVYPRRGRRIATAPVAEARITHRDDGGELLERIVVLEGRDGLDLLEPLASVPGASSGEVRGRPKPSRLTKRAHTLPAHSRVQAGDVAAHAVADEARRLIAADHIEQRSRSAR